MYKDKENKIPQPKTIARHYAEGKYCDYPTDIVLSAVNSHDYEYNPTAIPIKLGFQQMFIANFNAFLYLCEHRSSQEILAFLENPNEFMTTANISLGCPFDDIAPKIFATLVEDDMLEAMRADDTMAVCLLIHSLDKDTWPKRHPERYPRNYMRRDTYATLQNISYRLDEAILEEKGFSTHLTVNILHIIDHFSDV